MSPISPPNMKIIKVLAPVFSEMQIITIITIEIDVMARTVKRYLFVFYKNIDHRIEPITPETIKINANIAICTSLNP